MKISDQGQYYSLQPDFPSHGYVVILIVGNEDFGEVKLFFPLPSVFKRIEDIPLSIEKFVDKLESQNTLEGVESSVFDNIIIIPINFYSLYALKHDYNLCKMKKLDINDRISSFEKVIHKPQFNLLLVTPYGYSEDDKQWYFSATLPFSITYTEQDIEKFIQDNDLSIDIRSKYCGIYSFDTPIQYNWVTGEIEENSYLKNTSLLN